MSAIARHRIADTIAYRICQRGGHIPNRDRSLPDACDFHYREALTLADLIGPVLTSEDRFGIALRDIHAEAVRSIALVEHDGTTRVAHLEAHMRLLIHDLDNARADGTVLTYGYIQNRLRDALGDKPTATPDDASNRQEPSRPQPAGCTHCQALGEALAECRAGRHRFPILRSNGLACFVCGALP